MVDEMDAPKRGRFSLRDVPGTTIALTSLAVLGAAAVVTTPVWLWYRHKRKKADALARQGPPRTETAAAEPTKDAAATDSTSPPTV